MIRIPFHRPSITDEDIAAVVACLESGWLTTGPRAAAFEEAFASAVGVEHAVSVSSGTAAMQLALMAAGIGPGDEVITTPYTFVATLEAIEDCGARPVFVDVDPHTALITPEAVERAVGSSTRAILPVHVAGHPCDLEGFEALALARGLAIVDDAAHALGARAATAAIGALGTATCFSFYASKNLTTGEGGMVTCRDRGLAEAIRLRRLHGLSRDSWSRDGGERSWAYDVVARGIKANLPDMAAALGLSQLERFDGMQARRHAIAERYQAAFAECELLERPPAVEPGTHAWHLYMARLHLDRLGCSRDEVLTELDRRGIQCSVHFRPLHHLSSVRARHGVSPGDFPVADALWQRVVSLPIYPALSDDEVERVIETVLAVVRERAR